MLATFGCREQGRRFRGLSRILKHLTMTDARPKRVQVAVDARRLLDTQQEKLRMFTAVVACYTKLYFVFPVLISVNARHSDYNLWDTGLLTAASSIQCSSAPSLSLPRLFLIANASNGAVGRVPACLRRRL